MAYSDQYGITEIKKGEYNALDISWDQDTNESPIYPVLLFIPDKKESLHYHIELNKEELKVLGDWINDFLKGNK